MRRSSGGRVFNAGLVGAGTIVWTRPPSRFRRPTRRQPSWWARVKAYPKFLPAPRGRPQQGTYERSVARYAGSRVRGFAGSQVHGFAGSRVHGFAGSRVRGFTGSRVRGFAGSRVRGFAGSRAHGFAGSQVRGFAGSRVRGLAGSRVRGFAAFAGSRAAPCGYKARRRVLCLQGMKSSFFCALVSICSSNTIMVWAWMLC